MKVTNLCGSGIYHSSLDIVLKNEKEVISNLDYQRIEEDNLSNLISKNRYVLNNPKLFNIKQLFDKHLQYYLRHVLGIGNKVQELNSWVTINKQNDYHHPHSHPNVFISLCYYPQVESGDLILKFPKSPIQNIFNLKYDIVTPTPFNTNLLRIPLKTNNIVIFPGDIEHFSSPNESNIDRIMIGSNYFLKGVMGDDSNTNFIEF